MKIRISPLAPRLVAKKIRACLKKTGLEFEEKSSYGEIWFGAPGQVDLAVKKLAVLYIEVMR
jgi:hypothetical protein